MEQLVELAATIPDVVISIPDRRNWFREQLPSSLEKEIEEWLTFELETYRRPRQDHSRSSREEIRATASTRKRRKPIAPRTATTYRSLIRAFVAMQIRNGIPPERLQNLRDVVDIDNVDKGLAAYEQHFGGIKRKQLGQIMRVICIVAGHWVKVDDRHLAELRVWTHDVSFEHYGMSAGTKRALLGLRDPRMLANLLVKPGEIVRAICSRQRIKYRDAVLAETAFATQFILNAPGRIDNAAKTHLDENIRQIGRGQDRQVYVEYAADTVKNKVDLRYELTSETIELFDLHNTRILPRLLRGRQNRWLFPGEGDGPKSPSLLSQQIAAFTERYVGVRLTAHRLRGAAGYIHLRHSRNDTLTVSKLLGHRDQKTTDQYYIFLTQDEAIRSYDESLRVTHEEMAALMARPNRRTRKRRSP